MADLVLRLTLTVGYERNGETKESLVENLDYLAKHAAGEGLMSGEGAATVDGWKAVVEDITPPATRTTLPAKRMIDLSSRHITDDDGVRLIIAGYGHAGSAASPSHLPQVLAHAGGWLVFVAPGGIEQQLVDMQTFGYSEHFRNIYQNAARLGGDVALVNFSEGGPVIEGLPTFDW